MVAAAALGLTSGRAPYGPLRAQIEHGMQLVMATNGSRLSERIAQGLVEARVDRINILFTPAHRRPTPRSTLLKNPRIA